ncbi:haloacid dehalogenase type II [soil metagenome]
MPWGPEVVVFDVNETLSDMGPMAQRFEEVGAPRHLASTWFAAVLRDGFALATTGRAEHFSRIGAVALRTELVKAGLPDDVEDKVEHVMAGFGQLELHPDVVDGVVALHDLGVRLVTLTNGSAEVAERLLARGGVRDHFERLLSVEDTTRWKPAAEAYQYAADVCEVPLDRLLLVAVHPWDIDGASSAGMGTAWLNRADAPYPDYFRPPRFTAPTLTGLAEQLAPPS